LLGAFGVMTIMRNVQRVEFGKLAVETKALNLGQGFPDYMPPSVVTEALKQVAASSNPLVHQYTRSSVSNIAQLSVNRYVVGCSS